MEILKGIKEVSQNKMTEPLRRHIGSVTFKTKLGDGKASGILISPDLVLTNTIIAKAQNIDQNPIVHFCPSPCGLVGKKY